MLRTTLVLLALLGVGARSSQASEAEEPVRVFVFAGQSNMEGADSKVRDIERFPPFVGLGEPQKGVRFSYCIGREDKRRSDGWVELQPVNGMVGPELSFARKVAERTGAPIAIIKCAAGGTHLGGDWNPDEPSGFEMYPLMLDLVRSSLAELDRKGVDYRLEGFMWHQGENDMFEESYQRDYGKNLANFVARVREDLEAPELRFYVGELCTKTIWGMDLRPRMYAISQGQKHVTESDPLATYVPTSHVGVEIGGGVGLHYHYGTLGQLEHGINHADAYLATVGLADEPSPPLAHWPFREGEKVQLFVLAGHRNMEGERAFVAQLGDVRNGRALAKDDADIPFRYSLGGGYKVSSSWEPLGPRGCYDTFGPELSFGRTLRRKVKGPIALAKLTHSGSQIVDWTPEGSEAESRNLYPDFIAFVRDAMDDLSARGHEVELAGVFYHVGENDMSFGPFRRQAPGWIRSFVRQSRVDLGLPELLWIVSQQPPTDHESVNGIDVTAELEQMAAEDAHLVLVQVFDLPEQDRQLVLDTRAVVELGERLAEAYLER
jgi:hypothetical protein